MSERDQKLRKLNSKKKKLNPFFKWRYFYKENTQMANKYTKVLNTTNITEMQVKITMRHHLVPVRMATIKKARGRNKCWWGGGEKRTLVHCWGECKLASALQKTAWKFLKKKKSKIVISNHLAIPLLGYVQRKWNNYVKEISAPQCSLQYYLQ